MNISSDDERFRQIARIAARSTFSDTAMWTTFQNHVRENIHQFAGEGFYLTQDYPISSRGWSDSRCPISPIHVSTQ